MTVPQPISPSGDRISYPTRNVKRSLCVFLSCVGPGVNALCFQSVRPKYVGSSNRVSTRHSADSHSSPFSFSTSIATRYNEVSSRQYRPNKFYALSPLLAAPYKIPESPSPEYKKKRKIQRKLSTLKTPTKKTFETGRFYQRSAMMEHDILSREEEMELGSRIVRALALRDKMSAILEDAGIVVVDDAFSDQNWENIDITSTVGSVAQRDSNFICIPDDIMINNELYDNNAPSSIPSSDYRISNALVRNGSKLRLSAVIADLNALSEYDISAKLSIDGGRKEVLEILYEGVQARNSLMKSNIRLVVSIAKKWMKRNAAANSGEGANLANLYEGGWDRPSLDEAIQEGVLGLARAVDKYDPKRGLKFSTYSTYWITNYVRQSFQAAATGCLKVPGKLHDIKGAYKRLQMQYLNSPDPIPSEEDMANEIGVSVSRLRTALRVTEQLKSIDEPLSGKNTGLKGSGAGGDKSGNDSITMGDRLECQEIAPEEYVEISFLRQTLENAMAAELSPHERDILRLRLGLDDGQTRTVKQVVEEYGGGLSLADVRSAEQRAVKKLSSPHALYAHNLFDYIGMTGI